MSRGRTSDRTGAQRRGMSQETWDSLVADWNSDDDDEAGVGDLPDLNGDEAGWTANDDNGPDGDNNNEEELVRNVRILNYPNSQDNLANIGDEEDGGGEGRRQRVG